MKYHVHHHPRGRTKKVDGVKTLGVSRADVFDPRLTLFNWLPFTCGNGSRANRREEKRETDRACRHEIAIKGIIEKSARSP